MGVWTRKNVADLQMEARESEGQHTLKRSLGPLNLTFIGVGGIIGAGIFVLTGQAAAEHAGPAIALSFILAGFACLCAGLCYAEFAAMIPIAGSAYTYAYATMGELVAWIIGWALVLEYLVAASAVAVGWSGYFTAFLAELGLHLPQALTSAPLAFDAAGHLVTTGALLNVPAIALVGVLTIFLIVGIKESANFNNLMVAVKLSIVLLVIVFGAMYVNPANWHPFVPPAEGPGRFGFSGVVAGAATIFFAYIGFDGVSTVAQEARNPQRDMPIGILGSLVLCTILYIAMALVMTGLAPYRELAVPHPVFVAIDHAGPGLKWLGYAVNLGAIAGLASVVMVLLLSQSRVFFTMARDGLMPPLFSRIHPHFRTPHLGTLIIGLFSGLVAASLPIGVIGHLVSLGTLSAFVLVCAGIWILRRLHPELARPFRTPWVPIVPIFGVLSCGYMMVSLPRETWALFLGWMAIGIAIYCGYGRRHSRIAKRHA